MSESPPKTPTLADAPLRSACGRAVASVRVAGIAFASVFVGGMSVAHAAGETPLAAPMIALTNAEPDEEDSGFDPDTDERYPLKRLRFGLTSGWTLARHDLESGGELRRVFTTATFAWRALDNITVHGDVGAALAGDLTANGETHSVLAGPRVGFGLGWRVYSGTELLPFILFNASFAVFDAPLTLNGENSRLTALDFRTSLVIGKLVGEIGGGQVGGYVVARSLTGALYWDYDRFRSTPAHDRFQIGAGVVATSKHFDAHLEVVPFGERAALAGFGVRF